MKHKIGLLQRISNEIDWRDWRVQWVIGSISGAVAITILIYFILPSASNASTFWGAAFASWISGLLLTLVITLVVTIAQFARPERAVFEARARNLLRGQSGPHIDYIIPELQKLLQPYCEKCVKDFVVTEYDEETRMFRVNQTTNNYLRSYLNDMPVLFTTKLRYENGNAAPDGKHSCTLTYLKVSGEEIGTAEDFDHSVERDFEIRVLPNEPCHIEHRFVVWVRACDEPNRHVGSRYTRELQLSVTNHLPSQKLSVALYKDDSLESRIPVGIGETVSIVHLLDMVPGHYVYDFRLELD
ncbi:hypothetical protein [Stappia sp. ICDLI1TA098]